MEGSLSEACIEAVDPQSAEAAALIAALDAELAQRYPAQEIFGIDVPAFVSTGGVFLVLRRADVALACGAYRPHTQGVAEIKRMFVQPSARGRGYSRLLLQALEQHARGAGFHRVVLETGERQPEAIGLYEASGYTRIPRFGEYVDNVSSVCFAKQLAPRGQE